MDKVITTETIEERLAHFSDRVISHPILESVFADLRIVIRRPGEIPLIVVVGPTGVGKTTLVKRLHQEILTASAATMEKDPGLVPVILIEAMSPDRGDFRWGDFYIRFLKAAKEPMIDRKELDDSDLELRKYRKKVGSDPELRRAMEQCIQHRGTKVVIIDEAQHLTKVLNPARLHDQMDTIKSLASLSGAQFVMVGTYNLLQLLNRNGELARRTCCIDFPRYRYDQAKDRQSFYNILGMFEARLPLETTGVLVRNVDYQYEHCLGCIGTLKDRLKLAARHAIETGRTCLEMKDLEAIALSNDSLLAILQEILEGERLIESSKLKGDELRSKLGLQKSQTAPAETTDEKAAPPRHAVGERNLTRDPVGVAA
jgi:nucleoside-triphosphatase THEP1